MSAEALIAAPPGVPAQRATRIVFFIAGLGVAAWAPLVPYIKARTGLDDGGLGLLLLCLGGGSTLAMPAAGALAARLGCRTVIIAASAVIALALPGLAIADGLLPLALLLMVFGAGLGLIDIAINIQALIVERASGRRMMSGFHARFSLGGICGAAGVAALLAAGATPLAAAVAASAAIVVAAALAAPALLAYGSPHDGPVFSRPRGAIMHVGLLCFAVFLAEAAVLDWSAVLLTGSRNVAPAHAGFAYAAFAAAMTLGRLTGDRVVQRLGGRRVVVLGALCAAVGFALATAVPTWQATVLGCLLVGLGCANIVPVLFTGIGRQTAVPESVALPAVSTIGYAGILIGPALIGGVAHLSSLPAAFGLLALMLLAVAASARSLRL